MRTACRHRRLEDAHPLHTTPSGPRVAITLTERQSMVPKFCWAPASGDTHPLLVHAPHVFFEALRITFGPFPLTLTMDDIGVLRGMATRSLGERGYEDLLAALQGYGTIIVTTQFDSEGYHWPR